MRSGRSADTFRAVRSDLQQVTRLAESVSQLLRRHDRASLAVRPNSYEPTLAESIAMALLELDRIAGPSETLPPFASDFLNRRLAKRLLVRYPAEQLAVEFNRRLTGAFGRLRMPGADSGNRSDLERLNSLLLDLESALLQPRRAER